MYTGRRFTDRMVRVVAVLALTTTTVLVLALAWSWAYFFRMTEGAARFEPLPKVLRAGANVSPLEVQYRLELPGRGEIFPAVLTSGHASDYWPAAVLTVTNTSDRPLVQEVKSEIPGWSRPATLTFVLPPRQTRKLELTPELLPRALENSEIRRAELRVSVALPEAAAPAFSQSRPVLIHAASDLYWGQRFANAQLIARWVTPHDPSVLRLVAEARRYAPNERLGGYNPPVDVRAQAKAVFEALRRSGISYVSSISTFGGFTEEAQRVRLPRETLQLNTANCIDVSVAFASAMENVGLKPVIVIIPGHAFTGVKLAPNAREVFYLDLTVLPRGSFERAAQRAQFWLKKSKPEEVLTVDVAAARALGIYPLPSAPAPVLRADERE